MLKGSSCRPWCLTVLGGFLIATTARPAEAQPQVVKGDFSTVLFSALAGTSVGTGDVIAEAIGLAINDFPTPSAGSALVYVFDPVLGIVSRASTTLGPSFTQRPQTLGKRGSVSFGFTIQHVEDDRLDGYALNHLTLTHQIDTFAGQPRTTDSSAAITLAADIATMSGTIAVTDALDVTVVVPIVRSTIQANWDYLDIKGGQINDEIHTTGSAQATGIGDLGVHAKYRFVGTTTTGVAGLFGVRLPLGSVKDGRGTGATRFSGSLLASKNVGFLSPQVNVGYTYWKKDYFFDIDFGGPVLSHHDELSYSAGIDARVTDGITLAAAVAGRRIPDFRGVTLEELNPFSRGPVGLSITRGAMTTLYGTAGGKLLVPGSNVVVSANVVFQMRDAGLHSRPTLTFGAEYAF